MIVFLKGLFSVVSPVSSSSSSFISCTVNQRQTFMEFSADVQSEAKRGPMVREI